VSGIIPPFWSQEIERELVQTTQSACAFEAMEEFVDIAALSALHGD
jgi:hypothetical protein